jgi:hypothetical protein
MNLGLIDSQVSKARPGTPGTRQRFDAAGADTYSCCMVVEWFLSVDGNWATLMKKSARKYFELGQTLAFLKAKATVDAA